MAKILPSRGYKLIQENARQKLNIWLICIKQSRHYQNLPAEEVIWDIYIFLNDCVIVHLIIIVQHSIGSVHRKDTYCSKKKLQTTRTTTMI